MIAIKDFKMPEECSVCFACFRGCCRLDEDNRIVVPALPDESYEGRPEWCPLVDVPDETGNCSEIPNNSDGEYDPKPDIYYLAEKIGIHRLYALVVQLRGEPEFCIDTISRRGAVDAIVNTASDVYSHDRIVSALDGAAFRQNEIIDIINALPSSQPEQSTDIQNILQYLDNVIHPLVSTENWNVYSELHDMISNLPSTQPEIIRCKDCRYSEYDQIFHNRYCHNKGKADLVGDDFFCAAGRYMTNGSDR